MKVAFYSPLKPPNHWRPSGDRQLARLFAQALAGAGGDVQLVSAWRSWHGDADETVQTRDAAHGAAIARQLIRRWHEPRQRPNVWFTYHAYHKAPDWIGPQVCAALEIPYVLAEASIAHKRAADRWQVGYRQTRLALQRAAAVISLNPDDEVMLRGLVPGKRLFQMLPFMAPPARCAGVAQAARVTPRLVATGMMRPGDKLESYRLLAQALAGLHTGSWRISLIGDGTARARVQALFAPLAERVEFLGRLEADALARVLDDADLFAWPAHNEALGMAVLEAHAHALPAVVGYTPGITRIVTHGETGLVCPADDTTAMARALDQLLNDPPLRQRMAAAARDKFETSHTLAAATRTLNAILGRVARD